MSAARANPARLLVSLLCLLLGQASCSFAFVKTAPPRTELAASPSEGSAPLDCSSRPVAPVWDTIGAASSLTLTLLWMATMDALNSDDPESPFYNNEPTAEDRQLTLGLVGLTALYTGSAIYGYIKTSECRERMSQQQPRFPLWPPPELAAGRQIASPPPPVLQKSE